MNKTLKNSIEIIVSSYLMFIGFSIVLIINYFIPHQETYWDLGGETINILWLIQQLTPQFLILIFIMVNVLIIYEIRGINND